MNKRSWFPLWLALAVFAFPGMLRAQSGNFTFQFTQDGMGNTVVTGSGTGTTGAAPPPRRNDVGFNDNAPNNLLRTSITPTEWIVSPSVVPAISVSTMGPTLFFTPDLGGPLVNIRTMNFRSGGPVERLVLDTNRNFATNTSYTLSGSKTFADPFNELFSLYTPGTVIDVFGNAGLPGYLHFIIGVAPAPAAIAAAVSTRRRTTTPAYLVTNYSAIASANQAMFWPQAIKSATLGAGNTALKDLSGQIGIDSSTPAGTTGLVSNDASSSSSLLRYFAFMQDENMSYKVALGLADPEERTIEVNVSDTLSAQTGLNFNGQSLGGGLPYAMMGVPMVGGAATVNVVEAAPSGKTVIDDAKMVVEADPLNRYRLFVSGDFSFYDQDPLSDLIEGFDTDTYAGSIGFDYRINEWLKAGLAWSYVESDTNASANLGNMDLEGNMASVFASATWRQNWFDLLYSYGSFNNEVNRNTGLGSTARGDTDSDSHNVRLNFGHNINIGRDVVTGPIAGLRYGAGDIDAYSERGGGLANVDYDGSDFESMISRLGWQASHVRSTSWGRLISQVRLAWEHEFMPEDGAVSGSLQTSPFALVTGGNSRSIGGYSTEQDGAHPGTDWLTAGVGLRFELANGVSVHTDYEGVFFRSNSSQHYASAKLSYEWGAFMPRGKGKGSSGSGKAVAYQAYDDSGR